MTFFHETLPNCVPELYREQQEEQDHMYNLVMQRRATYLANQQKLNAAAQSGLPILNFGGYDTCHNCYYADEDTVTDDEDDLCRVICGNPACPEHERHQAKGVSP